MIRLAGYALLALVPTLGSLLLVKIMAELIQAGWL